MALSANGNFMYGNGHNMSFGRFHLFWGTMITLFLLFVLLLIRTYNKSKEKSYDASKILKFRYAKGEISKEEFETMKKDLEN